MRMLVLRAPYSLVTAPRWRVLLCVGPERVRTAASGSPALGAIPDLGRVHGEDNRGWREAGSTQIPARYRHSTARYKGILYTIRQPRP